MKNMIVDSIGNIDNVMVESVAALRQKKASKTFHWKRWVGAAACVCLLVAGSVSLFSKKEEVSPFVIIAYAMDADGKMTGTPIELKQTAPMTKIELPGGMEGFLFSVDLDDKNAKSNFYDICLNPAVHNNIEELYSITEEKGKDYFYFTPIESEDIDGNIVGITVTSTRTDGSSVSYALQIINQGGEYTAQLMDVKENRAGENGGVDGQASLDDKNSNVEIVKKTDNDYMETTPLRIMTADDISRLIKQESLSWNDFNAYVGEDIGSGLFVFKYNIVDGGYLLVSGTSLEENPQRIVYYHSDGEEEQIR